MSRNDLIIASILWIILFVILIVVLLFAFKNPEDYCADYISSQYILSGKSAYLPITCGRLTYNPHPPVSILALAPLALFPITTSTIIWSVLSFLFYILSGYFLLKHFKIFSIRNGIFFLIASLAWPAFLGAAKYHNISQLLLFLLTIALFSKRDKNSYLTGALIGLAGLLRLWPICLLFVALLSHQKKVFFSGLLVFISGTLVTVLILGLPIYFEYLGPIQLSENVWINHPFNLSLINLLSQTIQYFFSQTLSIKSAISISEYVSGAILLGVFVFIWLQNQKAFPKMQFYSYLLMITVALLTFPVSWEWGLILLLPGIISMFFQSYYLKARPKWFYPLFVVALICLADPAGVLTIQEKFRPDFYFLYRLETVGLTIFAILQAILMIKIKDKK